MRRRLTVSGLLICLMALLCGCNIKSGDDLYALPRTSVEYESLRNALQELLDGGLEYSAPLAGSNTQPVQDVDLDGDGVGEAVAFFKDGSGLQVYVFHQNDEGEYQVMSNISGQGIAVNSVAYTQLDGEGNREIVLSWQISSGVYALSAYSVWEGGFIELLEPQNYTRYSVVNLEDDDCDELILLHLDASDEGGNRAEYYTCQDGVLAKQSEAYLSADLATIDRAKPGALYGGGNALYITGYAIDEETGEASTRIQITDVLTLRDGELANVTRNEASASSLSTRRRVFVSDQDLDGDGIWEIPVISSLYERLNGGEICVSDSFFQVTWCQLDSGGGRHVLCNTYYNNSDGWYLVMPSAWKSRIALSRSDINEGITSERRIEFYVLEDVDPSMPAVLEEDATLGIPVLTNTDSKLFMTICKNSGSDRIARSQMDGRIPLETGSEDVSYSVLLEPDNWCHWSTETVQEAIRIITPNWFND